MHIHVAFNASAMPDAQPVIVPPTPSPVIETLADGRLEIVLPSILDPAKLSVQVDQAPARRFTFDSVQLMRQAICLTPPAVTGTAAVGAVLSVTPGLWLVDPAVVQAAAHQWYRDNTAIAGATGPSYAVQASDGGHTLACRETVGAAQAISAPLAIPTPPLLYSYSNDFDQPDNTALKDQAGWQALNTTNGDIRVSGGAAGMFANASQLLKFLPVLSQRRHVGVVLAHAVPGAFNTVVNLYARYTDASNSLRLRIQGGIQILQVAGGTSTNLYQDPAAMADGAALRLETDGSTVRYWRDGVLKFTGTTSVTSGDPALHAQNTAWPIDHIRLGSISIGELA